MSKKTSSHDPAQYLLDFQSGAADQRRRLRNALKRTAGADLRQWSFLLWIFNVETPLCGLVRDYDELAESLWCNRATAVRMVNRLFAIEFITINQTFDAGGGARKNEYRIAWGTIDELLRDAIASDFGVRISSHRTPTDPQSHGATGGAQPATTQLQNAPTYKELDLSPDSLTEDPFPEPEAEPLSANVLGNGQTEILFGEVPELQQAHARSLFALPAGELVYGAYKPLKLSHLTSATLQIEWHRRQLSVREPVAGATVADLLLTMAAARYADQLPKERVVGNRVALFVNLVSRGQWQRVLGEVPYVSRLLARWEAAPTTPGLNCGERELVHFRNALEAKNART